jgi:hypothetical protein
MSTGRSIKLAQTWDAVRRMIFAAQASRELPGTLVPVGGSFTVPDRPAMLHVRLDATGEVVEAFNGGVRADTSLKVLVNRRDNGAYVVEGPAWDAAVKYLGGETAPGPMPHQHRLTGPMPDYVEPLRFETGLVVPAGGTLVRALRFVYWDGEKYRVFEGGTLDLADYLPDTAGLWRWVVVGVDKATNALKALACEAVSTQYLLTAGMLEAAAFDGAPLAAVRCIHGDTDLTGLDRYEDMRLLVGYTAGGLAGLEASGCWPVTPPAGWPAWRRAGRANWSRPRPALRCRV